MLTFFEDCTKVASERGAEISVCGGVDDYGVGLTCEEVCRYATEIHDKCLNGDPADPNTRTGGTYTISPGKRIIVH